MTTFERLLAMCVLGAMLLAVGCGVGGGGRKKVVVNEQVCVAIPFLRMELGEESKIVLDNRKYGIDQRGLSLRIDRFPLRIDGDQPPNTLVENDLVSFTLAAPPGKEVSVDVTPLFAGTYTGACGIIAGDRSVQRDLPFQIVP